MIDQWGWGARTSLAYCRTVFLRIWGAYDSRGGVLLNCRFWLSKSGWSPRCCVSDKLLSDADAAGPQNTPWVAKQRKECKGYRDGNVGGPSYVQPLILKGPGR